jgi:hypothetical protein
MASCPSLPAARPVQAVGERRITEIRKRAAAGRDVERCSRRAASLPPQCSAHRHRGLGRGGHALGDVATAVDLAGCDVERRSALRGASRFRAIQEARGSKEFSFCPRTTGTDHFFVRSDPAARGTNRPQGEQDPVNRVPGERECKHAPAGGSGARGYFHQTKR